MYISVNLLRQEPGTLCKFVFNMPVVFIILVMLHWTWVIFYVMEQILNVTFAKFTTFKFLLTGEISLFLFIYFKQLQHQGLQEFTPKQPLPIYCL